MDLQNRLRLLVLALLLCAVAGAIYLLFFTPTGRQIIDDPTTFSAEVHAWVTAHAILAPLLFIAAYMIVGLTGLPIWWLQLVAGYSFGLNWGVAWTLAAAAITAVAGVALSRWLAGDLFRAKVESRMQRLRDLDEKLGHNGLLVVMAIRLMYITPFSISNYMMGLTRISLIDVFLGSILGGFPAIAVWVTIGYNPALFTEWSYWLIVGAINLLLVIPLLLRYLRPRWFRQVGIE